MAKNSTHYGRNLKAGRKEWTDYLPELLGSIEDGYLDDHLVAVARALTERRGHLVATGAIKAPAGAPKVQEAPGADVADSAVAMSTATADAPVDLDVDVDAPRSGGKGTRGRRRASYAETNGQPLGKISPVSKSQAGDRRTFGLDGSDYLYAEVIGRRVSLKGVQYDITGIGPKSLKLKPVDSPSDTKFVSVTILRHFVA